jgi:hypothetical protein
MFAPRIRNGEKTHTIRAFRDRPFRHGDHLYLWIEQRSEHCEWIGYSRCSQVVQINIEIGRKPNTLEIWLDISNKLDPAEANALAVADGFPDMRAMYEFWMKEHGPESFPWVGQIIYWDLPLLAYDESPLGKKKKRSRLRKEISQWVSTR